MLLVNYAVYGAWKDPASLGWPATMQFPPAATVPSLFGTRVHLGFIVALIAAFVLHVAVTYTRWGLASRSLPVTAKSALWSGCTLPETR